jgi:hypothetical protein
MPSASSDASPLAVASRLWSRRVLALLPAFIVPALPCDRGLLGEYQELVVRSGLTQHLGRVLD